MRRPRGSSAVARKRSQVSVVAASADARIPIFACSRSVPSNASDATRSATVKPIPATVPPPATAAQPTGGRRRPPVNRVARYVHPKIPSGFPTT